MVVLDEEERAAFGGEMSEDTEPVAARLLFLVAPAYVDTGGGGGIEPEALMVVGLVSSVVSRPWALGPIIFQISALDQLDWADPRSIT